MTGCDMDRIELSNKRVLRLYRNFRGSFPYGRLHDDVRLVLGMRFFTSATNVDICRELVIDEKELRRFTRLMRTDPNIRHVIEIGLPASFGMGIAHPVKCTRCNRKILHVPCVYCCTFEGESCRNDSESELNLDSVFTSTRPGSREKIEVMANRANRNLQIFHPQDRRYQGAG